ncbi:MAG: DUF1622 domain-containing protein [Desulfobacterales bacterium]|jgi:uncharacterized membrane protein
MTQLFEMAVIAFEALAVLVLIFGAVLFFGRFIKRIFRVTERHEAYREFRQGFGRTLLLALDLLVAADIILTVALDLSFETLGMLGLLVLIRTFLHFVLELEVTGRWPWQGSHELTDASRE